MKTTGKILIGLAGIFAAGAVIGALYAPDKGERTRHRITRRGRRLIRLAGDTLEEGKDKVEAIRDQLKDSLEQIKYDVDRLSGCASKS